MSWGALLKGQVLNTFMLYSNKQAQESGTLTPTYGVGTLCGTNREETKMLTFRRRVRLSQPSNTT